MKIAILGPSPPFRGGIADYTANLYRALTDRHEVLFCGFKRQYPVWLYPGSSDRDTGGKYPAGVRPVFDSLNPLSWRQTAHEISAFKPEVLLIPWWVHHWAIPFVSVLKLLDSGVETRIILVCHNVLPHDSAALGRWVSRWVFRHADAFLVHSSADKALLNILLSSPRVAQAELPVQEVPSDRVISKVSARESLGLPPDLPVFLFFGFVRPYKGLDILLEAFAEVLARQPCRLLVAGEFWSKQKQYREQIDRLGIADSVIIHDRYLSDDEVALCFTASDLVVLPYREASASGVSKLAYSHGRPVLVTRVGSLPQTVEEGRNGYCVEPGSPGAIAEKLHYHLQHADQAEMERSSFVRGRAYGWSQLLSALEELFTA